MLDAVGEIAARQRPELRVLADSRRGLHGYPAVCLKMNRAELGMLLGDAAGEPRPNETRGRGTRAATTAATYSSR